ncbi:pyridoxamine 5'-phosphate oxidase [Cytophagaceae bacterium ABcell3]|nr:pyridoxamine 5'-phosphate oxidase [Cytophagaceae bacterium ABcell3]
MSKANLNLADIRKDYKKKSLSEEETTYKPLDQFSQWLNEAITANVCEPTAMNFSTVSKDCRPTSRILLLKEVNEKGLVFFTNYQSRKGKELEENPAGCITFFWPELERQVRIEGFVEKISEEESEKYFKSRPFLSRVGATISPQSTEISKEVLEKKFEEAQNTYSEENLQKPEHWGGFCLIPDYFEFWQGRPGRLHDRICYKSSGENEWVKARLAP